MFEKMLATDSEREWGDCIATALLRSRSLAFAEIGLLHPKPAHKSLTELLHGDPRFTIRQTLGGARVNLAPHPMPTIICEIILNNDEMWGRTLTSWRWLWVLPQVCKAFRNAIRPRRTQLMQLMCANPWSQCINKRQARELFGLTKLEGVPYTVEHIGFEIHHMCRSGVLLRAMTKKRRGEIETTGTFEAINALFRIRNKS